MGDVFKGGVAYYNYSKARPGSCRACGLCTLRITSKDLLLCKICQDQQQTMWNKHHLISQLADEENIHQERCMVDKVVSTAKKIIRIILRTNQRKKTQFINPLLLGSYKEDYLALNRVKLISCAIWQQWPTKGQSE